MAICAQNWFKQRGKKRDKQLHGNKNCKDTLTAAEYK